MINKLFFRNWLVLAILLVPTLMSAQEDVLRTVQHDLKEYDWVDICIENPKYAIVTKGRKKGIYDMQLHQEVTPVEFREVGFCRQDIVEDSLFFNIFYATEGIKRGILSVDESSNKVLSIWMDDPDEVYSLEECTTLDKKMTKRAKKLLEVFIRQQQMDNAQIVILDAKSGLLKTWIALDSDMEKEDAGKLLSHSCSGSLTKPFHAVMALEKDGMTLDSVYNGVSYRQGIKAFNNEVMHHAIQSGYRRSVADRKWKELVDTSDPSTSPFIMAVGYNSLAHDGSMIIPTMKADSVNIENEVFSSSVLDNLRDVLKVKGQEFLQLSWLSPKTDWFGYATEEMVYAVEDKDKEIPVGKQIQFAGLFPVADPRYTICIVADKHSLDVNPSVFQDVINPLATWLLK